ncbi:MAG: MMPL family transporter [Planctomycetes bacterium]|nr:MMPL family transporter [Planctomycetota bacterium]
MFRDLIDLLNGFSRRLFLRLAKALLRNSVLIILVMLALAGLSGYLVFTQLTINFSIEQLFEKAGGGTDLEKGPYELYQEFQQQYGSDDNYIFIAFKRPQIFDATELRLLERISEEIEAMRIPQNEPSLSGNRLVTSDILKASEVPVIQVLSITHIQVPFLDDYETYRAGILGPEGETQDEAVERFRELVTGNAFYVGTLVSWDSTTSGVIVEVKDEVGNNPLVRKYFLDKIDALLRDVKFTYEDAYVKNETHPFYDPGTLAHKPLKRAPAKYQTDKEMPAPLEFHISGLPIIENTYIEYMISDTIAFSAVTILILMVILAFYFRNALGVILPLGTVGLSLTIVLGIIVISGQGITITLTILPTLLLIVGVADSIHIISDFRTNIANGMSRDDSIMHTVKHLGVACFMTSFTTAIGFGSLVTTEIPIVMAFGIFAFIGVMLLYCVTLLFVPAMLNLFGPKQVSKKELEGKVGVLDQLCIFIGKLCERHPWRIVFVSLLVFAIGASGVYWLNPRSDWFQDIHESSRLYQDNKFIEDNLTGVFALDMEIDAKRPHVIREQETIDRILEIQDFMRMNPNVAKTFSYVDLIEEIRVQQERLGLDVEQIFRRDMKNYDSLADDLSWNYRETEFIRDVIKDYQGKVYSLAMSSIAATGDEGSTQRLNDLEAMADFFQGGFAFSETREHFSRAALAPRDSEALDHPEENRTVIERADETASPRPSTVLDSLLGIYNDLARAGVTGERGFLDLRDQLGLGMPSDPADRGASVFVPIEDQIEGTVAEAFITIHEDATDKIFTELSPRQFAEFTQLYPYEYLTIDVGFSLPFFFLERSEDPQVPPYVKQMLLGQPRTDRSGHTRYDFDRTRVSVLLKNIDSNELGRVIQSIKDFLHEKWEAIDDPQIQNRRKANDETFFTPDTSVHFTGKSVLARWAIEDLMINLGGSLFGAVIIIFLLLSLMLWNIRLGFISMIPNIIPLFITAGVMGYLGINLNFSTMMVFTIALGIAVDDTIHFLARYRHEYSVDEDHVWAMHRTFSSSGKAIMFTTFTLVLGFAVLLISNFRFTFNFGLLGIVTIVSALFADLFLLPAILVILGPRIVAKKKKPGRA